MRSSTRAALALAATASLTISVASAAPAAPGKGKGGSAPTEATGLVFMVNPVQSSGDQTLTDDNDSATAVPASEYARVPLRNLDGTGYLTGSWVTVESSTGTPAYSAVGSYDYHRSEDQFEQVMAYFWVDQAQEYLQSLGFGSTLEGVVDEPLAVKVGQYGGDNSYQTDQPYRLRFGKGGVDDAEDAEVVVHEYGHAVHADQVSGFGASLDAGAIGEGFGDYLAVTVGLDAARQYGWPVRPRTAAEKKLGWDAEACVADWDATSYSESTTAKCLRRIDQDFTLADRRNQVHFDGMIWSRALWDIRKSYARFSTTRAWDTTLIASQWDYAPDTSFAAAATQTYRTALARDGEQAARQVKAAFEARGISVG